MSTQEHRIAITDELKNSIRSKYVEAQNKFIEVTNLKVGDRVKVLRKAKDEELGWGNKWNPNMDSCVGSIYRVEDFNSRYGIETDNNWNFPFFVLEKVEEPCKFKDKDVVLVRDDDNEKWGVGVFMYYDEDSVVPYRVYFGHNNDVGWKQCIPYKGHEHLIGTRCPADC